MKSEVVQVRMTADELRLVDSEVAARRERVTREGLLPPRAAARSVNRSVVVADVVRRHLGRGEAA